MPTYTRSELLVIRELMSQRRNSSANAGAPSNGGDAADPVRALWKKTKDIQKHVADLIETINRRKLKAAGKEKRIRKVFRFAWRSLADYHRQLQEQVFAMTMLVMPPIYSQLQPTDVESWMELIAKFKKQALDNCKHLKDLQMLLKYQMTLLEGRFDDIDQAIEELNIDFSDDDSSTEKTE